MSALKTFLSTALLGLFLALVSVAPAGAADECWRDVIKDWYDGRIDNVYPIPCYQEAIQHLPADVQTYSSAKDEITRALLAAIHSDRGDKTGGSASGPNGGGDRTLVGPVGGPEPAPGPVGSLIDAIGPSNAEEVPLPLLVLAVVAFLLLGAAAASFILKRVQARRLLAEPAPARAPARPGREPT